MSNGRHPGRGGIVDNRRSPYARLKSVDLRSVRWLPGFWNDRFTQCVETTLPWLWELAADPEKGHSYTNLRIAAGLEDGDFAGSHWQDEWVYKWLEAASYVYDVTKDESLNRKMDEIVAVVERAQEPDGYLATQIMVRGWTRFQDIRHHELYVMGHLITAACIHHRATGKTTLLNVAKKTADYLYETFADRDPKLANFGFNPSYIMALVELYRTTGDARYVDLANVFIDMRGSQPAARDSSRMLAGPGGTDQTQSRQPLREEHEVVGHMVLGTYLYCGAADVYMETGDTALLESLGRLWCDLTERKMYVHGGVCATHRGLSIRNDIVWEAADAGWRLPNSTAYNETCAQIGNMMWNWRMLSISGEARYADVMELSLYNTILSGIGLDGRSWFYTNVLRWYGDAHQLLSNDAHERFQPGLRHTCCPSNLVRTISGIHGYMYSVTDDALWVNLYGSNVFDDHLSDGTRIRLRQETAYPWDGLVRFTVDEVSSPIFVLRLRIPGWAEGASVAVNGVEIEETAVPGSYVAVDRMWSKGDTVELNMPMRVRLLEGHPQIEAVRTQVAVMRGPVVYCLESPDLPEGVGVGDVRLPWDIELTPRHDQGRLGAVTVLEGKAHVVRGGDWSGRLYRELSRNAVGSVDVTLIPYFAWCNRGGSEMSVWLPLSPSSG